MVVSFEGFQPSPRFDNNPWTTIEIFESADGATGWNLIDTQDLSPSLDPQNPDPVDFTTENASLQNGWYKVRFLDADNNPEETDPVYNSPPVEILATLDDINANLDGKIFLATSNNTRLIQISVARIVKGYLTRAIDNVTLTSWTSPNLVPDIIREIAAKLIAAQLYFNAISRTSIEVDDKNIAQRLYNEAIALLNQILDGTISLPDTVTVDDVGEFGLTDFFPIDSTDRAFTMNQQF